MRELPEAVIAIRALSRLSAESLGPTDTLVRQEEGGMKFNDDYSTVDHESVEDDDTCPDCGANGPENCTPECECLICAGKCRECRTALFDDERTRGTCRRCYGDAQALASERGAA